MAKTKGQNYMHGAAILTIGVIIMKILGFFYKIPLGNILGDEGYSMFMGAYSIYFIFFTLATAGLPVALSRLVAEADANGRARQEEKTFRVAWVTFTCLGLLFASVMFFFPNWLAAVYLRTRTRVPASGPWPRRSCWCAWSRPTGATARATATCSPPPWTRCWKSSSRSSRA